ncbi:MAG: hypothetical protein O3A00_09930 [Planctomycetota bacterium]|nr:hypothetical protein [Planctomycetota bacterium]
MSPPRRPAKRPARRTESSSSDAGTVIGVIIVVVLAGGLLALGGMVLGPGVLAVVGLIAFFAAFIGFHYLIWGRWLSRRMDEESSDEE